MALFQTEAIVVKTACIGEADLLVTLFARDYGKVKVVARGARVLKSRFSGFFELLSVLRIIYLGNERQELYRMASCDTVEVCDLYRSLERMMTVCCMAEMLDFCCGLGEADPSVYRLALEGIELLKEGNHGANLGLSFALKGLVFSGYMPHVKDCVVCGDGLEGDKLGFSPSRGGAVCGRCPGGAGEQLPMSMGSLKFLCAALALDLKRSSRIRLDQHLRREVRDIVFNHAAFNLGREMKSLRFLEL